MNMNVKRLLLAAIPVMIVAGIAVFSTASEAGAKTGSGWLGVYIQDVDSDIRDALDLKTKEGVLVDDVVEDSPAEKAGIRPGDVIVEFNGKDVKNERKLRYMIKATKPGDEVKVVVYRENDRKALTVEMGKSKSRAYSYAYKFNDDRDWHDIVVMKSEKAGMGIRIDDLNEQLGGYFGVKDGDGVLVKEVMEDSPADKAGIKAGDVIIGLDGGEVDDIDDLTDILREKEDGDKVKVVLMRDRKKMEMTVTLSEDYGYGGDFLESIRLAKHWPGNYSIYIPEIPPIPEMEFEIQLEKEKLKESLGELKQEMKELKKELKKKIKDFDID